MPYSISPAEIASAYRIMQWHRVSRCPHCTREGCHYLVLAISIMARAAEEHDGQRT